jgi:uncharacterized membrane protein YbhN (UPF0104 family)
VDVLKICFVTGLTFWLGNAVILGLSVAVRPDAASAINSMPVELNRAAALAALIAVVAYLWWISAKPRKIGLNDFAVTLPGLGLTLLQIAIGVIDLTLCSLAMFLLMPDQPQIAFLPLLVIFVISTLLGFASHSPSGLGVFDAAMLVALQQFETSQLIASLLLFRLLYYILPLAVALITIGTREGFVWLLAYRNDPPRL